MIKRTLMQRNQELVDFEVDPETAEVRVVDVMTDDDLLASAGLDRQNMNWVLPKLVVRRALSPMRKDKDAIIAAFGAKSPVELAFMGRGLSLSDQFWYRTPGSTDRWEDVNFFDNGWDSDFGAAVLSGDYTNLSTCSPDVPEATTSGHAAKAWERNGDGVFLVKAAQYPDDADLIGAKLASDLCTALFDEGCYVPISIVERFGRLCSASPLMLDSDEELIDGNRLYAMAGMRDSVELTRGGITMETCDSIIDAYTALGIENAKAHVARLACFSCLALLFDCNPSNFGAIRKVGSKALRAAPIFDFDGSFGFPFNGISISDLCKSPWFVELLCAQRFSFLDASWDWSWYDPQALDGFEDRIVEAYAPYRDLPPRFAELIARLFDMQHDYANKVASGAWA